MSRKTTYQGWVLYDKKRRKRISPTYWFRNGKRDDGSSLSQWFTRVVLGPKLERKPWDTPFQSKLKTRKRKYIKKHVVLRRAEIRMLEETRSLDW